MSANNINHNNSSSSISGNSSSNHTKHSHNHKLHQQVHIHPQLQLGPPLPPQSSKSQLLSSVSSSSSSAAAAAAASATPSSTMRLRLRRQPDQQQQQQQHQDGTGAIASNSFASGFGFGLVLADRGQPPVLQIDGLAGGGSEAEQSGLVRPGDIILRINNVDVSRCTFDEALQTLASTPVGAYASFIVRAPFGFTTRLVTTFEEDGTPRTLRITERTTNNSNNNSNSNFNSNRRLSSSTNLEANSSQFQTANNILQQGRTTMVNNSEGQQSAGPPCANCQHKSGGAQSALLTNGTSSNSLTANSMTPPSLSTARRGSTTGLKPIKLRNVASNLVTFDTLHHTSKQPSTCNDNVCLGSIMNPIPKESKDGSKLMVPSTENNLSGHDRSKEQLLKEAYQFMEQYYASIKRLHAPAHRDRLREIEAEVHDRGTYELRQTELIFGAKLAWRNAPRCIGRIQWSKLQVFDARSCTTARDMFEAVCNQIKYATNRGNLRSAITILPQRVNGREDFRIWNQQLVAYAGYADFENANVNGENGASTTATAAGVAVPTPTTALVNGGLVSNGSESKCPVRGDPINIEFTKICQKLGWKGTGSRWDILPIVVSTPGEDPQLFPLPEDLVIRIPIVHPRYEWFETVLQLQWYALPAVSSMKFDVGGIEFPACPFSGWYMDTEVAVRDLCDPHRYNVLPLVAAHMGLDTASNATLWKDRAAVEVTAAVLYSYQRANVTIVDHYTAAESFMKHLENENRLRGGCPADWVWIVPPISGSLTPVFHQEMLNYELKPAYKYQDPPWKTHVWKNSTLDGAGGGRNSIGGTPRKLRFKEIAKAVKFTSNLFGKALSKRIKATILYATETGRSELFAKRLGQIFSHAFNVSVNCMDAYDTLHLEHETLLLIVTSTFGNGDPPENGESLAKQLQAIRLTGEVAHDLDRDSISVPVTYHYSVDQPSSADIGGISGNVGGSSLGSSLPGSAKSTASDGGGGLNQSSKNVYELSIDERRATGPNSPTPTLEDSFAFADHVGPLSNIRTDKLQQTKEEKEEEKEQSKTVNEDVKEGESTFSSTSTSTPTTSTSANQSSGKSLRFSGRYGVFALGSSAYPNFCAYGKYLDTVLAELGGERVSRLGTGDELCGQEQSFNEWATTVFEAAADVFCLTDDLDMSEVMKKATLKPLLWSKENVRLEAKEVPSTNDEQLKEQNKVKRIEQALSKLSNNKKVMHYKLLEREFLHEVDSKTANVVEANLRQTIRVSLQTDLNQTVEEANEDDRSTAYYLPGDHLAVYPQNEAALVSALIKRLTSQQTIPSPSAADRPYLVKIRSQQSMENGGSGAQGLANGGGNNSNAAGDDPSAWTLHDRLPAPVSLREALTRYLDITTPPTQQFLAILAETATESAECAERMKHLARDSTDYETWKAKSFPNLIEVLQEFQATPSLELIFTQLPLLQPRYYSISSSPLSNSACQLDLTVAVVQYTTATGAAHNGVCSTFLKNIPVGENVYGFIRSAPNFRLPKERDAPLIMVGPGTGIAPFRAFWEHRARMKALSQAAYGEMKLFFGCRYPSMQLYKREIEAMMREGVISEYYVAYSRKAGQPKKYVQDNMKLCSQKIFSTLMEENGHIYVCGDVSMAEDVNKTLKAIMLENGVQDVDMAIYSLKKSQRYHEDIFGITLRTAEVTNKGRSDALVKRTLSNT